MLVFWNDNFVGIYQGSTRVSCPPACSACSLAGDRKPPTIAAWAAAAPVRERRRHAGFGRAGELRSPDASVHIVPRLRRKSSRRTALACSHSNAGSALRTVIRLSHSRLVGAKAKQAQHRTRRNDVAGREHHDPRAHGDSIPSRATRDSRWASAQSSAQGRRPALLCGGSGRRSS
jgi:hypothetical protein